MIPYINAPRPRLPFAWFATLATGNLAAQPRSAMPFHSISRFASTAVFRAGLTCTLAATAALLAGCASTPLPPWPAATPAATAQPGLVVAPGAGMTGEVVTGAVANPVPPPSSIDGSAPIIPSSAGADAPFGPAVAAHFPAPPVRYSTPGLEQNRRAFTTNAELSEWLASVARQQQRGATRSKLMKMGPSQEGQPVLALILTRGRGTSPDALGATGRPTVVLIGQQRGDEPAGAEALLVLAQELSSGLLEPLLDRINVILVPRANPDAADSGNPYTAAGVDMVNDHLLVSTPEARAIATLVRDYRPTLVVDAREFAAGGTLLDQFGGVPTYDALLEYSTTANMPDFIGKAAREWYYEPAAAALGNEQLRSDWSFSARPNARDAQVQSGSVLPDTARNISALKNAVGMVVSTRGVGIGRAHLQRRVHTQVVALSSLLRSTAERASSLEQVRSFVARDTASLACRGQVTVNAAPTPAQRSIALYDVNTGAERVHNVRWDSPLQLRTGAVRPRPCGYWIAATSDNIADRLQLLGLQVLRVAEGGPLTADSSDPSTFAAARPGEMLARTTMNAPAGSFYVPLNQPLANVAIAALEPGNPAGYLARGVIDDPTHIQRIVSTPNLVFEETN